MGKNGSEIKALVLFVLWGLVHKAALGGIKYGLRILNGMKVIKPIWLTTQDLKIENGHVILIGRNFHLYAKRSSRRIFYELLLILTILKSINIIRRENIQIVISPGTGWINDITSLILSIVYNRKIYTFFHHWPYKGYNIWEILYSLREENRNLLGLFFALMERILSKKALLRSKIVFTVSEKSKDELKSIGVPCERIVVAYPGVDEEFFKSSICREEYADIPVFDVITVTRISPEKGIYDLIKIGKILVKERKDIKIGVIGHPTSILDKWLALIKKSGLESNIRYLGIVERSIQIALLKKAKVFIFPSYKEGFGIAMAEAMACGLPVVCYDISPLNKIFNSGGVIFIREGDYESFARKVMELLDDEKKRNRLGAINRSFSKRFSWTRSSYIIEKHILQSL